MTYKEIINRFRQVTEDHLVLQDFGYGELSDLKTQSQLGPEEQGVDYPYLFLLPAPSNRTKGVMNYSFNMIVMDMARPEEGDTYDNYVTIQSQCQQYIDDVLAHLYFYYKDQPEIELTGITYTPFKEKYQDELAGMTATITIAVPTPLNDCIAPFDNNVLMFSATSNTSYQLGVGEDGQPNGYIYAENVALDTYDAWSLPSVLNNEIWQLPAPNTVIPTEQHIVIGEGAFTFKVNAGANQEEWYLFRTNTLNALVSNFEAGYTNPEMTSGFSNLPATVPAVGTTIQVAWESIDLGAVGSGQPTWGIRFRGGTPAGLTPYLYQWLTQESSSIKASLSTS